MASVRAPIRRVSCSTSSFATGAAASCTTRRRVRCACWISDAACSRRCLSDSATALRKPRRVICRLHAACTAHAAIVRRRWSHPLASLALSASSRLNSRWSAARCSRRWKLASASTSDCSAAAAAASPAASSNASSNAASRAASDASVKGTIREAVGAPPAARLASGSKSGALDSPEGTPPDARWDKFGVLAGKVISSRVLVPQPRSTRAPGVLTSSQTRSSTRCASRGPSRRRRS